MATKLSKELAELKRKAEEAMARFKEAERKAEEAARKEWDRGLAAAIKAHRIDTMDIADLEKELAAIAVKYNLKPDAKAGAKPSAKAADSVVADAAPEAAGEAGNAA